MKFREHIIFRSLAIIILLHPVLLERINAQQHVPPIWEQESVAAYGSFTRHLDSMTGVYQQSWNESFEAHLAAGTQEDHLDSLRMMFMERIGPFPERSPLNARVEGIIQKEGYTVEKILFESLQSFYISALLFLPDPLNFTPPYPGILIPCGHAETAKGHDEYQAMGALCALNGLAALVFDPLDQGERHQLLNDEQKPISWGTRSHNMEGIRATLLGRHMAGYFTWDGIRAIDYLLSREELDYEKIGISGNSGGGTQTTYIFVADKRIKAAAPSCFIHTIFSEARLEMGDAEQNVFGQIRDGLDHADYAMMRAPQPYKILAATHDFFRIYAVWDTYRYAKRYYTSLGYSERVDILENLAGHNYNRQQREAAVQWMLRWLAGRDEVVREPEIELLTPDEYTVAPEGYVLLLDEAKSINDIFKKELAKSSDRRRHFLSHRSDLELADKIRELTGIDQLSEKGLCVISRNEVEFDGYTKTEFSFESVDGYTFPASYFHPSNIGEQPPLLFLSERGAQFHLREILKRVEYGQGVMVLELPGTGRLRQKERNRSLSLSQGVSWEDCNKAYLMGRSIVGYRVRDILDASRFLVRESGMKSQISLHARGETGIPALHAAFLDSQLFDRVEMTGTISSWEEVVQSKTSFNQLVNTVYDALNFYDLNDLIIRLGDKIVIKDQVTVHGLPLDEAEEKSSNGIHLEKHR